MVDGFVAGELTTWLVISVEFVGMQRALARGVHDQHVPQTLAGQVIHLDGTGASATLYQRHDEHLFAPPYFDPAQVIHKSPFFRLLRAEPGFVGFNRDAFAAERAAVVGAAVHRLADAMRHEPRRAIGTEAEGPHELVRAKALL